MSKPTDLLRKTKEDALAIFMSGVKAVSPEAVIHSNCRRDGSMLYLGDVHLNMDEYERIYVVGAGKATAPMAASVERLLGDRLTEGTITVKYGHTFPLQKIRSVEAAHPIPDANGEEGSAKILEMMNKAGENDLVICLISGGGSALTPLPVTGISLADKQGLTSVLLACGATIHEINAIRKHLSAIKGGRLARAAYPATVVSLMLSDVVGDDLDVIASGPTVPDNSTFEDCLHILWKYDIEAEIPQTIREFIRMGVEGKVPETPKPGDKIFQKTSNIVIGSNLDSLRAAEEEARDRGYNALILSSLIQGETDTVSQVHAAIAGEIINSGHPIQRPACVISGGETTVTLKGDGLGGRNQEFALCATKYIANESVFVILSGGTDGNDGPTDASGAISDNTTLSRASQQNLNVEVFLANNDSYNFFQELGDLIVTGPTNTNVMDIRLIIVP